MRLVRSFEFWSECLSLNQTERKISEGHVFTRRNPSKQWHRDAKETPPGPTVRVIVLEMRNDEDVSESRSR